MPPHTHTPTPVHTTKLCLHNNPITYAHNTCSLLPFSPPSSHLPQAVLLQELREVERLLKRESSLPLDPAVRIRGLTFDKCSFFSSFTVPLKLSFKCGEGRPDVGVIFKVGVWHCELKAHAIQSYSTLVHGALCFLFHACMFIHTCFCLRVFIYLYLVWCIHNIIFLYLWYAHTHCTVHITIWYP